MFWLMVLFLLLKSLTVLLLFHPLKLHIVAEALWASKSSKSWMKCNHSDIYHLAKLHKKTRSDGVVSFLHSL